MTIFKTTIRLATWVTWVTMLSKQVVVAVITYPAMLAEPHQPKHFNFPKRELRINQWWSKVFRLIGSRNGPGSTIARTTIPFFAILVWKPSKNWRWVLEMPKMHSFKGVQQLEVSHECFQQHELSNCHEEAAEKIITLPATTSMSLRCFVRHMHKRNLKIVKVY